MSKAPETIYLQHCDDEDCNGACMSQCIMSEVTWCVDQINENDQKYVRADIAHGYASEAERLKARIESMFSLLTQKDSRIQSLESTLRHVSRNASVMTAHEIETMARDALGTK